MKDVVYTLFSDKHIRLSNHGNYPAKLSMTGHEGTDVSKQHDAMELSKREFFPKHVEACRWSGSEKRLVSISVTP